MTCPFCSSADVERVAQWGGQIITAQWRCRSCGSYFEALREEFDDQRTQTAPGAGSWRSSR
jgi:transposase-like protein